MSFDFFGAGTSKAVPDSITMIKRAADKLGLFSRVKFNGIDTVGVALEDTERVDFNGAVDFGFSSGVNHDRKRVFEGVKYKIVSFIINIMLILALI